MEADAIHAKSRRGAHVQSHRDMVVIFRGVGHVSNLAVLKGNYIMIGRKVYMMMWKLMI
jgi:hypothetical protein